MHPLVTFMVLDQRTFLLLESGRQILFHLFDRIKLSILGL